jgi:hypothetical protein
MEQVRTYYRVAPNGAAQLADSYNRYTDQYALQDYRRAATGGQIGPAVIDEVRAMTQALKGRALNAQKAAAEASSVHNNEASRVSEQLNRLFAATNESRTTLGRAFDMLTSAERVTVGDVVVVMKELGSFAERGLSQANADLGTVRTRVGAVEAAQAGANEILTGLKKSVSLLSLMASQLTNDGLLTTGRTKTDLARGCLRVNGIRVDVRTLLLSMVIGRASRFYIDDGDSASRPVLETLFRRNDPAAVVVTLRVIATAADQDKRQGDLYGIDPATGAIIQPDTTTNKWPINATVFRGGQLCNGYDINTLVKAGLSVFAMSMNKWYTTLAPLFSEEVASLIQAGPSAGLVIGHGA